MRQNCFISLFMAVAMVVAGASYARAQSGPPTVIYPSSSALSDPLADAPPDRGAPTGGLKIKAHRYFHKQEIKGTGEDAALQKSRLSIFDRGRLAVCEARRSNRGGGGKRSGGWSGRRGGWRGWGSSGLISAVRRNRPTAGSKRGPAKTICSSTPSHSNCSSARSVWMITCVRPVWAGCCG